MKLLILDVDGVLTDGTKVYGPDGTVLSKRFCDHDFTAIKKFQADGVTVVWLSADKTVNEAVAKSRNIPFFYSREPDGTIDKVKWYHFLMEECGTEPAAVTYVGDDLLDLPVIRAIVENGGRAYCPANAVPQFDRLTYKDGPLIFRLGKCGGDGAIMALYTICNPTNFTPPSH